MAKVKLGPKTLLYPMPSLLIGANVNNKPTFMTIAWSGIVNGDPPMISIAVRHVRYTMKGIKQNGRFSVNIPSVDQMKETDYCGIISGSKEDKVKVCKFDIFYGHLADAPMIEQCPVNLDCQVVHTLNLGSHELIIGKIEETYISDNCLTNGYPDLTKIKPLIFFPESVAGESSYGQMGKIIGKAFNIGREFKK